MSLTKYPIVLVHGLAVKSFPVRNAFGRIPKELRKADISVHVLNQDGVGTIENNARQMKVMIEEICRETGMEKVNIIAHSKGGLDSRYMIAVLGMHTRVATLTTLSTPHHGSRLSTIILRHPAFMVKTLAFFINIFYRICGDRKPDVYAAAIDLTDEKMRQFNETVPNSPSVYYQSYSATLSKEKAFLTYIPYKIIRWCEKDETDGLVSVESSRWGTYQGHIAGNPNHLQMISLSPSGKRRRAVAAFYKQIIAQLAELGF